MYSIEILTGASEYPANKRQKITDRNFFTENKQLNNLSVKSTSLSVLS
ncbi:MAG: hypothetical protein KH106_07445 [Lactococcus lactis]|nr:hypothetical protein [Lactococcus lactis]